MIEVWNLEAETLLALEEPFLVPLAMLARHKGDYDELLRRGAELIARRAEPEHQQALRVITALFGSMHSGEVKFRILFGHDLRREDLMSIPGTLEVIDEMINEAVARAEIGLRAKVEADVKASVEARINAEREFAAQAAEKAAKAAEKAAAKAAAQAAQEQTALLAQARVTAERILTARFGAPPAGFESWLANQTDPRLLSDLQLDAAIADSIEEFSRRWEAMRLRVG